MAHDQLTICIITKDNQNNLTESLALIKGHVGQIVVVDLGSKDQTISIAKEAGAQVCQMDSDSNLGEAKNLGFDKATGRWVLFLHGNELIYGEDLEKIKGLLRNPNVEGYLVQRVPMAGGARIVSPVQSLRLIRNRKEYRYHYRAFEWIPGEIMTHVQACGIRLNQKAEWNYFTVARAQLLLVGELKVHPEDSYLQYQYGIQLLNQQQYQKSTVPFQKAIDLGDLDDAYGPHLYKCYGWALLSLKNFEAAFSVVEEGIKAYPLYMDLYVFRGQIKIEQKNIGEAIDDFKKSLAMRARGNGQLPRSEIHPGAILESLGDAYKLKLSLRSAYQSYEQAYSLNRHNQKLLDQLGELSRRLQDFSGLEAMLVKAIEQKQAEQFMVIMDTLFEQRQYELVLSYMEALEGFIGVGEQTKIIRYYCHRMLGQTQEAGKYLAAIEKSSPAYESLFLKRIEIHWFHGQWQAAEELLKRAEAIPAIQECRLYSMVHQKLRGQEITLPVLNQEEYESIKGLMGGFLWLGQIEKAGWLLTLLLKRANEDQCVKLGQVWAAVGEDQPLEKILCSILNTRKKQEAKAQIIEILLRNDHAETAEKFWKREPVFPLPMMEEIFKTRRLTKSLKMWVKTLAAPPVNSGFPQDIEASKEKESSPSKSLIGLYNRLKKQGMVPDPVQGNEAGEWKDEALTNGKIHWELGRTYEKQHKQQEALIAYLRVLQWEPNHRQAQEKIFVRFEENPDLFRGFLKKNIKSLDGNLFFAPQAFINYVLGLICFQQQQYERSAAFFLVAEEIEGKYQSKRSWIWAQLASSLWFLERPAEAAEWLQKENKFNNTLPFFLSICADHIKKMLEAGCWHDPNHELVLLEKSRLFFIDTGHESHCKQP